MAADTLLFLNVETSASLVTEKTGLAPTDLLTLLSVTAGTMVDELTEIEVTVYRPYYVAAKLLATRKTQLESAEGAKFVDPLAVAEEYLQLQRAIDGALGLTIPAGAEAVFGSLQGNIGSGYVPVIARW